MKTLLFILTITTGLLLFSTIICGLWLRSSSENLTVSSLNFHMMIGIATAIIAMLTIILAVVRS